MSIRPLSIGRRTRRSGFTLLEVVVYLGIVVLVTVPATTIAWVFIHDAVAQERVAEVDAVGAFALTALQRHLRSAQVLDTVTVYDVHPGTLAFTRGDGMRIVLDTAQRDVPFGGQTVTVRKLRVQEGSGPALDLTSDAVDVTQFIVRNRTTAGMTSIEVTLGLAAVNPGDDTRYGAQRTWTTAATFRR
ncbi:MAG: prepilin-type N-terminal cleavage/methylation domain-containing protein [bacterium]|nr:prepilin-type N-terminal cleavage/methylation domain-containing protein [bacterium]